MIDEERPNLLIGYSGLVGQSLLNGQKFDVFANSQNLESFKNKKFSLVVCAAPNASMFKANLFPEKDRKSIDNLIEVLATISASRFVLISTVAVLEDFQAESEQSYARETKIPYGKNRGLLENFCLENFERPLILRLPTLFSPKLSKNFIFDIVNPVPAFLKHNAFNSASKYFRNLNISLNNYFKFSETEGIYYLAREQFSGHRQVELITDAFVSSPFSSINFTSPNSKFQPYPIEWIGRDLLNFLSSNEKLIHVAPPQFTASEIFNLATGKEMPDNNAPIHVEHVKSNLNPIKSNLNIARTDAGYMFDKKSIEDALVQFFSKMSTRKTWMSL